MKENIRRHARELGFDDCRFTSAKPPESAAQFQRWLDSGQHGEMHYLHRNAYKRVNPGEVLAGARSIITLAISYAKESLQPTAPPTRCSGGLVAAYARYADYHEVIGGRLKSLTEFVDRCQPTTRSLWYVDTGPFLERDLAQRAGIGFVGKHTNLISRRLGNWFFLSEIITTLELEPDPSEVNHCGKCARCIAACPTAAITAPFQLDSRRCISYLTIELKGSIPVEFRPAIGNRIYGCDDCLAVCPWNRFAREGSMMKSHTRSDLCEPDLLELLSLDDAGFKRRFSGTPILRTKRRGLLRNVCVALGNMGGKEALPALLKATHDHEPLIQEHARWAIERIEQRNQPFSPV